MKINQGECHFLSCLDISTKFLLPASMLENVGSQKRPGVKIDKKLNFNKHVINLYDKESRKIQALAIIHIPKHKSNF